MNITPVIQYFVGPLGLAARRGQNFLNSNKDLIFFLSQQQEFLFMPTSRQQKEKGYTSGTP